MRRVLLLLAGLAAFLPVAASAQQPEQQRPRPPAEAVRPGAADRSGGETQRSPGPPVDRGPMTPDANAAHRGGGAVLEGAPGAPAPPPLPTPPLPAPGR